MKEYYEFDEHNLHMVFGVTEENRIRLLHFSKAPWRSAGDAGETQTSGTGRWQAYFDSLAEDDPIHELHEGYQFAQINLSGLDRPYERQGSMYIGTAPGADMEFEELEESRNAQGRLVKILQKDPITGVEVETSIQFYDGLSVARFVNTVTNRGAEEQTLEYISSFSYLGLEKEGLASPDRKMRLHIPHNGWQKEALWQTYTFEDLGLPQNQPHVTNRTSRTIEVTNTGNWSTKDYLPMAFVENNDADTGLFFQIEQNGSWHWEIGMQLNHFFLNVSGPTEIQSHWSKNLKPGDAFTSVPVCAGVSSADFSEAMDELTRYRRRIRRKNADDEKLPVIFNDYMNCLFGDPTTEKEMPLIEAAAKAGCEYYVIDAGWYADGAWWDGVGEWQESRKRFPNGIREVTDAIRAHGMIPGVWLELEVMGIHCDLAKKVPDDWFFLRHGKRVHDRSRYQLDFRNPEVIRHVTEVVDRVVNDYGVGYIKMDYNIEPGIGTERDADSCGDGLLQHERAYLAWLDGIFAKYPDLVIENCSSGGLRMDYAMLSRYSIQSTSDQEDYVSYSTIAANVPSGCTSEQAAVWSYPLRNGTPEETVFNMVNAMLARIHQSGHLAAISQERFDLVAEGIAVYKKIRKIIPKSVPFWPLGTAHVSDPWAALVIRADEEGEKFPEGPADGNAGHVIGYLAVWRRDTAVNGAGSNEMEIPLGGIAAACSRQRIRNVTMVYPEPGEDSPVSAELSMHAAYHFTESAQTLSVRFALPVMARIFELEG